MGEPRGDFFTGSESIGVAIEDVSVAAFVDERPMARDVGVVVDM